MADDRVPSSPSSSDSPPDAPARRKVYQPTLLPERHRRRFSPWLVIPGLLLVLGAGLYALLAATHRTRFVPSVGEIVYAANPGTPGPSHLWIMRSDGANVHPLTSGVASDTQPAFAPDGSRIAFLSDRDGGQNQIFAMDADGANLFQVTRNTGAKSQPAWASGDQGLLGYLVGGALNVIGFTGNSVGAADRLLPPPPEAPHVDNSEEQLTSESAVTVPDFAWSPAKDGGLAAVEDTGDFQALAVVPSLASGPKDVQPAKQGNVPLAAAGTMSLGWSPDGKLLAVAMLGIQGLPEPASGILLFDRDGKSVSARPPLLNRGVTAGPQNPVFSPNGAQIVFEVWSQPDLASRRRLGLYEVPMDGSQPPRPLYTQSGASDARFSPDGSVVFFLAERPGGHDLCRIAPDGSGFTRLSDGRADITGFTVSPQKTSR